MTQTISMHVKNEDDSTFRHVIKPDTRYFNGNPNTLAEDMYGPALISVNKPITKVKKDLEDIIVKQYLCTNKGTVIVTFRLTKE